MSHTPSPGPWAVRGYQIRSGDVVVARVTDNEFSGTDCPKPEVAFANARLIAAAPEMLDALKLAQSIIGHPDDSASQHIASVIAKAEGRT